MANRRRHFAPKKHKSQSLTGQKGINLIEYIVLDMGFVWNPTNLDAGIDGTIELRDSDTEEASNFIIQVQSKATEKSFVAETDTGFEYVCDERDLDYWLKGNCPVILICSNVTEGKAYWVSIKDYFNDQLKKKSKKVIFHKVKNAFTKSSKDDLLRLAIPETSGYYLSPPPVCEQLYSNLLKLKVFPDTIYQAETEYRGFIGLWNDLNKLEDKKGINKSYLLREGKIFSINNLSESPWNRLIAAEVKSFPVAEWSNAYDRNKKNLFTQLLNNAFESFVYHKNIIHKKSDKFNLYYFRPVLDDQGFPKTKKLEYNRLGRKSSQTVCERYYRKSDPSVISYFRHLAFEVRFMQFDQHWYMELTPTYYFTHDGYKVHTYYENKLKGKKRLDRAETVFSEMLFWTDVLTRHTEDLFNKPLLEFEFPFNTKVDVGINERLWLEKEDQDIEDEFGENSLNLFDDEY